MRPRSTAETLRRALWVASALLLGSLLVAAVSGPAGIVADWWIVRQLRIERAVTAGLVGAALAASGAAFQVLLRNPLASPYLLGVSGGGSLGAVAAILLGLTELLPGYSVLPVFSFAGCLGAIALIHAAASWRGDLRAVDLLLAGVVANSFFLAVMSVLQYLADPSQTDRIVSWTLGSVRAGTVPLYWTAGLVALGLALLLSRAQALNVLAIGDETAQQLGVEVARLRRRAFLAASLMTAAAVAVSGPVGFVGLFVPHGARFFVGADLRVLLPTSALGGAAFLVLADTMARSAFGSLEIPVGVVTSVIGVPCFLVLMMRQRRREVEPA